MLLSERDLHDEVGYITFNLGGEVIRRKNQIVANSRTIKAAAIVGGPSSDFISQIKLGFVGFASPPPVLQNETSLVNPIIELSVPFSSEPRPYFRDDQQLLAPSSIVTWTGIVPVDESHNFDEAGLFSTNGYMFSRATFPSIQKPSGVTLSIRWTIEL